MKNYFKNFFQRKKTQNINPDSRVLFSCKTVYNPTKPTTYPLTQEEKIIKGSGEFIPITATTNLLKQQEVDSIISTLPKIDVALEKKVREIYHKKSYDDYDQLVEWIKNTWEKDYVLVSDIQKNLWPQKSFYQVRYYFRRLKRDGYLIKNEGKILRISDGKCKRAFYVINADKINTEISVKKDDFLDIISEIQEWRKSRKSGRIIPYAIWRKILILTKKYPLERIINEFSNAKPCLGPLTIIKIRKLYKKDIENINDKIIELYENKVRYKEICNITGRSYSYVKNFIYNSKIKNKLTKSIKEHVDSVMKKEHPATETILQTFPNPKTDTNPRGSGRHKGGRNNKPIEIIKPDGTKIRIYETSNSDISKILKEYCK